MDTYTALRIYSKRRMNAQGWCKFWEIHLEKLPDPTAKKMVELSRAVLEKIETQYQSIKNQYESEKQS